MNERFTLVNPDDVRMYICGQWEKADDGSVFRIVNPSGATALAEVPRGGQQETARAIESASEAFGPWSEKTAYERAKYLLDLRDLMLEHRDELARLMGMEMGKVYTEAYGEAGYAASFLEWFAEEGKRMYGELIPASSNEKRLFVIKQPIGVTAIITPWNFPLAMMTRKVGPALAAGCTCVIKPASQSALSALAFARLAEQAGIPAGVINVVTGGSKEITGEIFTNQAVKKVSFTGSTEVGKQLVIQSSEQLKKLSLELGGHAPFIVFDDADLDKAAAGAVASKFRNTGQTCVCANRLYVHRSVLQDFSDRFVQKVRALRVGSSLDKQASIGPLVNESGLAKVDEHVQDAVSKGAKVLCGGQRLDGEGYFYAPTVLADVTDDMLITTEETFGPVVPLIVFDSDEEVVQQANDTVYGLAAYLYTRDISRAIKTAEGLEFGIIGLNDGVPSVAQAPFGGIKQSGYGKEGGHQGLQEYVIEKFISLGL